jgi:hypothetical protein
VSDTSIHRHGNYIYADIDCPICAEVMRKDTEAMLLRLAKEHDSDSPKASFV